MRRDDPYLNDIVEAVDHLGYHLKPANEVSRRTEVLFYHGPFVQATNSRQQLPNGGGR
jgi:hypothetical protein